ncbi:extracellular solute-binding protein [Oscillospiraceae bacterium BX1]|uniref:Extracellular solute-binding protein n=2 Tax=Yanshouia hominis TaxID=2763673 RepID=A0ABR7NL82_9FIRM|nr:extracellular solute-binding protein [Yanshouia hominis]
MEMFKRRKRAVCLALCLSLIAVLPGCGQKTGPDPKHPVTLEVWHNFGGQMQATMDGLVDTFNLTVGKEKGIVLNVTSVSGSAALQEKLTMIANGDPGAPEMPDLTTCYPATAVLLQEKDLLAPLDEQFTQEELSLYLPRFLEEGRLSDGKLYVFPFAKSTEVLFVNQTLFDRFASETGVTMNSLSTFEGIAKAALRYYEWTDAQTPDLPNDGKDFYTADSAFNLAQVGMRQMGGSLLKNESLDLSSPEFQRIWDAICEPAVKGGYALYDGYSSDLSKTGEIVCSTGSTAGILFYGTEITYPDNTTERVEYSVLPFPVFQGGQKIAIQRGSGIVAAKTTPEKERAAAIFLKWFTAPEQNMKFIASTGYLPVTNEAFENSMEQEIADNENIQKLFRTAVEVHAAYDFYIPPVFDGFNSLSSSYGKDLLTCLQRAREQYLALLETESPEDAYSRVSREALEAFRQQP